MVGWRRGPGLGLPVKAYQAIQRLYTLLEIAPGGHKGAVTLSQEIQGVISIDRLLATPRLVQTQSEVTAGRDGATFALTVPDGKHWDIMVVDYRVTGAGDNLVRSIVVLDDSESTGFGLSRQTPAPSLQAILPTPLPMEQKDGLYVDTDGTGSAVTLVDVNVWLLESDAY